MKAVRWLWSGVAAALGSAAIFAAPEVTRCDVIPGVFSPGQRVAVVAEGTDLAGGSVTVDFRAFGGERAELVFEIEGGRAIASGTRVPDDLAYGPGAVVPVVISLLDASGEAWTDSREVAVKTRAESRPELNVQIKPQAWQPGSEFVITVRNPDLKVAAVSVDFREVGSSKFLIPMRLSKGMGLAVGRVPEEVTVPVTRPVNVLMDVEDVAGNLHRIVEPVQILAAGPPPAPSVSGITITPNVIEPGRPYTVEVTGMFADSGVAVLDFRPHAPSLVRLPLSFQGDVATASGIAPGTLPEGVVDLVSVQVIVFSAAGTERARLSEQVPYSSVPRPSNLDVSFASPQPGTVVASEVIDVSGSVAPDVFSLDVNGVPAQVAGGRFSATVPLREGSNELAANARDTLGNLSTASIKVTRDTTAPILNIEVPSDGAVVTMGQVTVAGLVNDLVSGTVNEDDVSVTVNGIMADVMNRSYEVQEFVLAKGENTLEVVATDLAGNSRKASIKVTFQDAALQQRILIGAGNNQAGIIGNVLSDPLLVEVVDRNGASLEGIPVCFEVVRGDGKVINAESEGNKAFLKTNEDGQAEVLFQLGSRVGEGNNRVKVTSPGFMGEVVFCASTVVGRPSRIAALQPANQIGEPGKVLPQPFQVYVTDEGGNPMVGIPVRFRVTVGSGTIYGQSEIELATNRSGRISVPFVPGDDLGVGAHRVIADLVNGPVDEAAVFSATVMSPGAEADTTLVGVVLDSGNNPMPGVTAHIEGTALSVLTDGEGQFEITSCPVGAIRLLIDGTTTSVPGAWPHLEFDLVTIAGEENSVDRPIYLLELDVQNEALAGGDEDVVLTLEGVPGASLTVFANSVTGKNGEDEVVLRWTQVNLERVPMAPPQGSQFMLALTLQPAGVRFDPPARIQIPNMGAPAGQQVEMFSFDHDIGEFVAVGTATVSDDGAVMASDPGFGLTKAGWHGCVPPPPPCKPWEGDPPMDTPCRKWEVIPPDDRCEYTRYKPHDARILSVEAMANGMSFARVFTGEDVAFSASAESEYCDGVEYTWDPGDGSGTQMGASFTHQYTMKGTYTATVTAMCTGCPTATKTGTVQVEVFEEKIVIVKDSDGRESRDGLLQVAVPTFGESITAMAEFEGGTTPEGRPVWQTPDGEKTGESVNFSVTSNQGLVTLPIFGPFPVEGAIPERYTVACDDGTSVRIEAWSNRKNSLSLKTDALEDWIQDIEKIRNILGDDDDANPLIEFLVGDLTFAAEWQECPTSNLVYWTWKLTGGFNPLLAISGDVAIGPTAAISWLSKYLGGDFGIFIIWGGSISLTGGLERDNCGMIGGTSELAGNIFGGLEARLVAPGVVDIRINGKTGITGKGSIGVSSAGIKLNNALVEWDGVTVGVTVTIEDDFLGGIFDVEINRSWVPIGPQKLLGPTNLNLINF